MSTGFNQYWFDGSMVVCLKCFKIERMKWKIFFHVKVIIAHEIHFEWRRFQQFEHFYFFFRSSHDVECISSCRRYLQLSGLFGRNLSRFMQITNNRLFLWKSTAQGVAVRTDSEHTYAFFVSNLYVTLIDVLKKNWIVCGSISNGNPKNRAIWIDGGIHAREWISPASVTYVLNNLVEEWDDQPSYIKNLNWYGNWWWFHFDRFIFIKIEFVLKITGTFSHWSIQMVTNIRIQPIAYGAKIAATMACSDVLVSIWIEIMAINLAAQAHQINVVRKFIAEHLHSPNQRRRRINDSLNKAKRNLKRFWHSTATDNIFCIHGATT